MDTNSVQNVSGGGGEEKKWKDYLVAPRAHGLDVLELLLGEVEKASLDCRRWVVLVLL